MVLDERKSHCRLWEPPAENGVPLRFSSACVRLLVDLHDTWGRGSERPDREEGPATDGDLCIFAAVCETLRRHDADAYSVLAQSSPLSIVMDPTVAKSGRGRALRRVHALLGPAVPQFLDRAMADRWVAGLLDGRADAESAERLATGLRSMVGFLLREAQKGAGPHVLAPAVRTFAGWLARAGSAEAAARGVYDRSAAFRQDRRRHEMLDRFAVLADEGKRIVALADELERTGRDSRTASREVFLSLFDEHLRPWSGAVEELAARLWERQLA